MKKTKRGSHVGVVLSFVIFMTALLLIFAIVQPNLTVEEKNNIREYLQNEILEQTSEEITTVSVSLTHSAPQSCVELNNFFSRTGIGDKIFIRSDSGNVLSTEVSGQNLLTQRNGNIFFRVYWSEEFEHETGTLGSCQSLNEGEEGYVLGLAKTTKHMFETKVIKLINDYNADYDATKRSLGIVSGDEFDFGFEYHNGTTIETTGQEGH
ncbi:MAG TPA: hypothetical protein ENH99_01850 [Candidatus Pacearchaeota archaeon]|nr:hypothetical protein [Candidatus Pacearchaeota archaeon]